MEHVLTKDKGHSLVLMTSESFQEALEEVFIRAKEAAISEMGARSLQDEGRLMTKQEAMHLLGKSANTLWKWSRRGYLTPTKVGGRVMYRSIDINKILGNEQIV